MTAEFQGLRRWIPASLASAAPGSRSVAFRPPSARIVERHRAAAKLRHVAHDGEAEAAAGNAFVESLAAAENRLAPLARNAGPVVLDRDGDRLGFRDNGHDDAGFAPI